MTLFDCGKRACLVMLFALSAACGGGGDAGGGGGNNPPPPPPPANTGIGSAGGTVTEPSGAKVVIPPGALTTNTAIAVTQTSTGAPALPTGVTPFGQIYAFTPHGTAFAAAVTITVPFTPTQVPAGTTPVLYKTNAGMTGWAEVAGATVNGGSMSGDVRSFSFVFVGPLPPPPLEKGSPSRNWTVLDALRNREFIERDGGEQIGKELKKTYDFGPTNMVDPGVPLDLLPRDFRATGLIFSSPGGGSYGVSHEAPRSQQPTDPAGNFIDFSQSQSYVKHAADAKLTLVITQARIEAFDDDSPNPGPCAKPGPKCTDQKYAQIIYQVKAFSKPSPAHPTVRTLFDGRGFMSLAGWRSHWKLLPAEQFVTPIWTEQDVQTDVDVDGNDGRGARVRLNKKLALPIDISSIDVNEEFTLDVQVDSYVFDGRPAAEFNFLGAFFRDPTVIDGTPQVITEGLDPTDSPSQAPPVDDPNLPAECHALPAAGTIAFASPAYDVPEGAASGGIDLLVMRTGGSAGEVSATVKTSDGTATAPGDYQNVNTTITFNDGEIAPRFINVPLAYNTADEGDKTFTVTLSGPTGCGSLGQATSEVTIIDDTRPIPPALDFTLGGTVSGLAGSGLLLRTSGFDQREIAANGPFAFVVPVADGTAYSVSVVTQPNNPLQTCTVTNGSGTITGANVTNILVNCVTQQAAAGLDESFGTHGKVFDAVGFNPALALQPDGKLLVVRGLTLSRYNTNGSNDTTFGAGGHVTIVTNGGGLDEMKALALQSDGKIVVAGFTSLPTAFNQDWMVLRFNANGTADMSFGSGGKTLTDFDGMNDEAKSVLIQSDGKIVVAGQVQLGVPLSADQDFAVVRYLADGTPDPAFGGGDGKATLTVGGHSDFVSAAALQADGKIIVVGRVFTDNGSGNSDMGIVRFFGSGDVDTTFGNQGIDRIDFREGFVPVNFDGGDWDEPLDVIVQSDGKILVGGYRILAGIFKAALVRLESTGQFDINFGMVTSDALEKAAGIALQPDGKIVAAGADQADFGIARFTSGGVLDQSFGADGKVLVDFFGASDAPTDVLVQPDGKIIAAGVARNGSTRGLGLVRVVP